MTMEELQAIRTRSRERLELTGAAAGSIRVRVGMATCGIAAGARPVLEALAAEVEKRALHNIVVTQTGCIGVCRLEPIVEVCEGGKQPVTYVKMSPDKVPLIVSEHLVNGRVVAEYTIGAAE